MGSGSSNPSSANQPSGARVVTVVVTPAHVAVMDPPVPLLRPLLEYRARAFRPGGPQGFEEVEETRTLCSFDVKGRLCFPAGLLPRLRTVLREHGYRVRVEDRRKPGPRL